MASFYFYFNVVEDGWETERPSDKEKEKKKLIVIKVFFKLRFNLHTTIYTNLKSSVR